MQFTLTLGPSSADEKTISEFLEVASRFRLNASHLSRRQLQNWLQKLASTFESRGRQIPVVVDLKGAKTRIGKYPITPELPGVVTLSSDKASDDPATIPVPHELFFEGIKPGDEVSLNDGRVLLRILEINHREVKSQAKAEVVQNGPLRSFKGINRTLHPITYAGVTHADSEMIEASAGFDFVEYAFSFVYDGREAALLRPLTGKKRLIAKVERVEALQHIPSIDRSFDEIWLCRGDLGAQAGLERIGKLQSQFTSYLPKLSHPAVLAGQVLEYMTHFPYPTRTEVAHLHDVRAAGFNGVVLSDETAVGRNPLAVARFLRLFALNDVV